MMNAIKLVIAHTHCNPLAGCVINKPMAMMGSNIVSYIIPYPCFSDHRRSKSVMLRQRMADSDGVVLGRPTAMEMLRVRRMGIPRQGRYIVASLRREYDEQRCISPMVIRATRRMQ